MAEPNRVVFLSYASQDTAAARQICEALRAGGIEVWFDTDGGLEHGDEWDGKIRRQIKECALFIPIISANTEARHEGYFRLEWELASERAMSFAHNVPFILPIAIDGTLETEALVPDRFRRIQWTRLPGGLMTPDAQTRFATIWSDRISGVRPVRSDPAAGPEEKSVAVLPFVNLSADPENEYFSDAMTEEIINALVHVSDLRVAARTSSFAFKGKRNDLRTVAATLNVRTILEGSVRKSGDRIRIIAQLINAADGFHLWSEKFDRRLDDIFAVQDEIARTIAAKLKSRLAGGAHGSFVSAPTDNLEAYQLYLQGRHFWNQRGAGIAKGLKCYEAALTLDPDFALAHTGVADAYALMAFWGYARPNEATPRARAAAERALALEPDLAEAHAALAYIMFNFDRDVAGARREFQRAIELKPTYASARYWLAGTYMPSRRHEAAVSHAEEAVRLEPFSLFAGVLLGWQLINAGRLEEAAGRLNFVIGLEPRFFVAHWLLGGVLVAMNRPDDGLVELRKAVELSGNNPWMAGSVGFALAFLGQKDEARVILGELQKRAQTEFVKSVVFALLHAYLGDEAEAFAWLERAKEENEPILPYMDGCFDKFAPFNIPASALDANKFADFIRRVGTVAQS